MSFSPVRLNHAVLLVADLSRAEAFHTGVFGMAVAARDRQVLVASELDRWPGPRTAGHITQNGGGHTS